MKAIKMKINKKFLKKIRINKKLMSPAVKMKIRIQILKMNILNQTKRKVIFKIMRRKIYKMMNQMCRKIKKKIMIVNKMILIRNK